MRRTSRKSRLGALRACLGVLCALFFGPRGFTKAFRKRSGVHFGTLWAPESMLPSRREHRFPQISVSAISLHLALKIGSQNDHLHARLALKTRPKRLKSAPRRVQSASRALPDALGDAFWLSLRVSERIGHASACSVRSSSARLASQKRCGSVLGSILGYSS